MKTMFAAAIAAGLMVATTGAAQAVGCVSGAAVGGVAGHYAGHHGVLGAAAGCVVGHHQAVKNARARQNDAAPEAGNRN